MAACVGFIPERGALIEHPIAPAAGSLAYCRVLKEIGRGPQMVREPEDIEERAEPLVRGAGLVEFDGKLFDLGPVGFAVAVGERSPWIAH